jgi:cellulose synthase/poly-beta-1,6-N-acetylglucosamine synthase-like glycosyltransferase
MIFLGAMTLQRYLHLVYFFAYLMVWWSYCGYLLFLLIFARGKNKKNTADEGSGDLPTVAILVPCYNEEKLIKKKAENLARLDYDPERLEVFFLDGMSTDASVKLVEESIKDRPNFSCLQTNRRGKINQLNFLLPQVEADIIVNTDVDGLMEQDALLKMVEEFRQTEEVAVVGALVSPVETISEEMEHWYAQNRARVLETRVASASTVIGTCYGFRKGLIKRFPEDVVADDVYASLVASAQGKKVIYSHNAWVWELRAAKSLREMFRHKFRKSHAVIKELMRFLPKFFEMKGLYRAIFLTKFLQQIVVPWALILFLVLLVVLLVRPPRYEIEIAYFMFALFLPWVYMANKILSEIKLTGKEPPGRPGLIMKAFLIGNLCLVAAGLAYPFYRQKSRYRKVS